MEEKRPVELLSPAKNLECGKAAIDFGADAVYIGAPKFSARAAAGNSLEDIKELCDYAHFYRAKVYVALNTILYDNELDEVSRLIWRLYEIGVDALIIQDMGILELDIPPIPLHASTQTDNRTEEKVKLLENAGFSRVVLARELSLNEISRISQKTSMETEVFVHGALCVCYSGNCYLSQAIMGRSANRGECAQCCRLPYRLLDSEGREISGKKHYLSLKDLNRSEYLEQLIDAGVTSLKIEGRLKDIDYVKNVTAYYRKKLDAIFKRRSEYCSASHGHFNFNFEPDPKKSFNRGFTEHFLKKRGKDISSMDTPKWKGEYIGKVRKAHNIIYDIDTDVRLNNGDGITFFDETNELQGFRINRVKKDSIIVREHKSLKKDTSLYRNLDVSFISTIKKCIFPRRIPIQMEFSENSGRFSLFIEDEFGNSAKFERNHNGEAAKQDQSEKIREELSKLGNSPFIAKEIKVNPTKTFVPISKIAEFRRIAINNFLSIWKTSAMQRQTYTPKTKMHKLPLKGKSINCLYNVSNKKSLEFYKKCGADSISMAYEIEAQKNVPVMQTKFCLLFNLGLCLKNNTKEMQYRQPFYLVYNNISLRLEFDCKKCQMEIWKE